MYIVPVLFGLLLPFEAELDFSTLPSKGRFRYELNIELETVGGDKLLIPMTVGKDADPSDPADTVYLGLQSHKWTVRQNGLTVTIMGKGKNRIKKVTISSATVGVGVNWILPKAKKE